MAHFAKIENNKVVFVGVGREDEDENILSQETGEIYKKTSYNTRGGIHYNPETGLPSEDQSKAFRKNYAGIDYIYDSILDAFIPPKRFNSWILNETTCLWDPPIPYPLDGNRYYWDEDSLSWKLIIK